MALWPSLRRPTEVKDAASRRHSAGPTYVWPGMPVQAPLGVLDLDKAVDDYWKRVGWVYRVVDARAKNLAKLRVEIATGREVDAPTIDDHPIATLLNRRANKYETARQFRYRFSTLADLSTKGVFVEVLVNRRGDPGAVHLLNPKFTFPIADPDNFVSNFEFRNPSGEVTDNLKPYSEGEGGVLWYRRPHPTDPYMSSTWLEAAGLSVDVDHFARLYGRNFMLNDGRPGGVLMVDGGEEGFGDDTAAMLQDRVRPGPQNAGRIAVVEAEGVDYVDFSTTPRDMQYVEGRAITKGEILAFSGTPESVFNASGRTYDNADAELEGWWMHELQPEAELIASMWEDLTPGGIGNDDEVVTYAWDEIPALKRTQREREQQAAKDLEMGAISVDEYREITGKDPLDLPGTRVLWLTAGKAPVGSEEDVAAILGQGAGGGEEPPPGQLPPGGGPPPELPPGGEGDVVDAEIVEAEDPIGDLLLAEAKQAPPGEAKADPKGSDPFAGHRAAHAALIERYSTRLEDEILALFRRQENVILSRLKGAKARKHTRHWESKNPTGHELKKLDPEYIVDRRRWIDEVVKAIAAIVKTAFGAAGTYALDQFDSDAEFDEGKDANEIIAQTVRIIAEGFDARAGHLQTIVAERDEAGDTVTEIAERVSEAFLSVDTWAEVTSRQVVGAMNAAQQIGATQGGATRKRWLATDDERTRRTHREAEGQVVDMGDKFSVGKGELMFPGDPTGPVGEWINCRCTMLFQSPERDFDAELDEDLAALDALEGKAIARRVGSFARGFATPSVSFDPSQHPRDHRGRFIDTPDIQLPDGSTGVAVSAVGDVVTVAKPDGDVVEVDTDTGSVVSEHAVEVGPGPKPEFVPYTGDEDDGDAVIAHGDEQRRIKNEWQRATRRALALGVIDNEQARENGYYGVGHDQAASGALNWQPLPDRLYHATTDLPAVQASGALMSRDELAMKGGGAGLGGGDEDTVSFTDDPAIAADVLRALHEYNDVLNGRTTMADLIDDAREGGYLGEFVRSIDAQFIGRAARSEWKDGDPLPPEMLDESFWTQERMSGAYKSWAMWRHMKTGVNDPGFIFNDVASAAALDPAKFGIVEARPKPNAHGYQLGALGEWRTFGEAVDIVDTTVTDGGDVPLISEHAVGRDVRVETMPKGMQYTHRLRSFGEPFRVAMYQEGVGPDSKNSYFNGQEGLVGFVDAYREPNGNVNIGYIATRPGFERQGIATALMAAATDGAPEVDVGEIMHNAAGAIVQRMLDEGRVVHYSGPLHYPISEHAVDTTDFEGRVGDRTHITRVQRGTLPTSAVAAMPGARGEAPGDHANRQGEAWEKFKADIAANGITTPLFITVDPGEEPVISEGNHRRDAAVELGLTEVPVEVRFFGHAERTHPGWDTLDTADPLEELLGDILTEQVIDIPDTVNEQDAAEIRAMLADGPVYKWHGRILPVPQEVSAAGSDAVNGYFQAMFGDELISAHALPNQPGDVIDTWLGPATLTETGYRLTLNINGNDVDVEVTPPEVADNRQAGTFTILSDYDRVRASGLSQEAADVLEARDSIISEHATGDAVTKPQRGKLKPGTRVSFYDTELGEHREGTVLDEAPVAGTGHKGSWWVMPDTLKDGEPFAVAVSGRGKSERQAPTTEVGEGELFHDPTTATGQLTRVGAGSATYPLRNDGRLLTLEQRTDLDRIRQGLDPIGSSHELVALGLIRQHGASYLPGGITREVIENQPTADDIVDKIRGLYEERQPHLHERVHATLVGAPHHPTLDAIRDLLSAKRGMIGLTTVAPLDRDALKEILDAHVPDATDELINEHAPDGGLRGLMSIIATGFMEATANLDREDLDDGDHYDVIAEIPAKDSRLPVPERFRSTARSAGARDSIPTVMDLIRDEGLTPPEAREEWLRRYRAAKDDVISEHATSEENARNAEVADIMQAAGIGDDVTDDVVDAGTVPKAIYGIDFDSVIRMREEGFRPGPGAVRDFEDSPFATWAVVAAKLNEGDVVPARNLTVHGQRMSRGWVTKRNGIPMLVADGYRMWARDTTGRSDQELAMAKFDQMEAAWREATVDMPADLQAVTNGLSWSANPRIGANPSLTVEATGGDGTIAMWSGFPPRAGVYIHEAGHNIDTEPIRTGGVRVTALPLWRAAMIADRSFHQDNNPYAGVDQIIEVGKDVMDSPIMVGPARASAPTRYGAENPQEDFAESLRLYFRDRQHGTLGLASTFDGREFDVRFADIYPGRAAFFDDYFSLSPRNEGEQNRLPPEGPAGLISENASELSPEQAALLARFNNDEPLHPDLAPYLYTDDDLGWQILKHPLVFDVPFTFTSMANERYNRKRDLLVQSVENEDWRTAVFLHERPYRLGALLEYADDMTDDEFWELAGDVWVDTENHYEYRDEWQSIFTSDRPGRELLMDEDERAAYAALPERVTVYRGAAEGVNEDGPSWTLDKERAEWFAHRFEREGAPVVLEQTVDKDRIVALFTRRGEDEVVLSGSTADDAVISEHVVSVGVITPGEPVTADPTFNTDSLDKAMKEVFDQWGDVFIAGLPTRDENNDHVDRLPNGWVRSPYIVSDEDRVAAKKDVSARIVKRMPRELFPIRRPDFFVTAPDAMTTPGYGGDASAAELEKAGYTIIPVDSPEGQELWEQMFHDGAAMAVNRLVAQWATSSNDHDAQSLAIQEEAADLFGVPDVIDWEISPALRAQIDDLRRVNGDWYRAFLQAQYDETQEYLAEHGITELPVYRGMQFVNTQVNPPPAWTEETTAEVPLRPLASFSVDPHTAQRFAHGVGLSHTRESVVISGVVPASRVLSIPRTGVGALHEWEVVIVNGPGNFTIVRFDKPPPSAVIRRAMDKLDASTWSDPLDDDDVAALVTLGNFSAPDRNEIRIRLEDGGHGDKVPGEWKVP